MLRFIELNENHSQRSAAKCGAQSRQRYRRKFDAAAEHGQIGQSVRGSRSGRSLILPRHNSRSPWPRKKKSLRWYIPAPPEQKTGCGNRQFDEHIIIRAPALILVSFSVLPFRQADEPDLSRRRSDYTHVSLHDLPPSWTSRGVATSFKCLFLDQPTPCPCGV
jgi:hypothetical protein